MKKIMWMLIGVILGKGAYASEASPNSRIEAAELMYEVALEKNKTNTECIRAAQKWVTKMQTNKQNLTIEALDSYKNGFMAAYGIQKETSCTPIPDITERGFSDRFKKGLTEFPFPKGLTTRLLISKKGEFLNNIFAKETVSRTGVGLKTKILPQDQIDEVITYLKKQRPIKQERLSAP